MVNRYQPHVLVLPEDDANRQLANGFLLDPALSPRSIQVLPEVGGWNEVLNRFNADHVLDMGRYPHRFMVLLIDFDGDEDRLLHAKSRIPAGLAERVFVLGSLREPEELRGDLGSFERIGRAMAEDCRRDTETTWTHRLLRHNSGELGRLRENVRPFLFSSV
jgi:hypothetical protein